MVIITDACTYGLGGVMAHVVNGEEKPISFTSFTLNEAQRKYPILHLEALAVVCTVKKFHKFLYGKKFKIYTDHKPLIGILGKEGKNSISVTRLQRYVMELAIYDYEIVYRQSSQMGNADFCSRFPLMHQVPEKLDREYVKSLNFTDEFPINYKEVAIETRKDKQLQRIMEYVHKGWPDRVERSLLDVFSHYQDLEVVEGCLLFQDRVIIPQSMKQKVIKMLHLNHSGINKIKQLARRTVYWFGMNRDLEDFVKLCRTCNETTSLSKKPPYSEWIPTSKPFSRIHADFFYFNKKTFLVVVDSHTKWVEVEHMRYGTDHNKVIKIFHSIFARYGLPDVLVTDGGPPFNSGIFTSFFEKQGIKVMKSPPYHPKSNGQAERIVRLVKNVFKKFLIDPDIRKLDTDEQISLFIMNYRNTCLGEDNKFPSERLLSYKPKVLVDLLNPKHNFRKNLTKSDDDQQNLGCKSSDTTSKNFSSLEKGDLIYYKNINKSDARNWLPAKFLKHISSNILQVSLGSKVVLAHKRQLKILPVSRRKTSRILVFQGENREENSEHNISPLRSNFIGIPSSSIRSGKRKHGDMEDDFEISSDSSSDFYGFAAEPFIFAWEEDSNQATSEGRGDRDTDNIRRSRRKQKKRRMEDYIYY